MTFEVEVGGRTFTVAVERTDRPGRLQSRARRGSRGWSTSSRTGDFGLSLLDMGTADRGTVTFSPATERENVTVPRIRRPADRPRRPVRATFSSVSTDVPSLCRVNGRRSAHAEGRVARPRSGHDRGPHPRTGGASARRRW